MCHIFGVTNESLASFSIVCTYDLNILTIFLALIADSLHVTFPSLFKTCFLITADKFSRSSSSWALICTQVIWPSQGLTLAENLFSFKIHISIDHLNKNATFDIVSAASSFVETVVIICEDEPRYPCLGSKKWPRC